ncbi:hypothetical protein LEP1GSC103_0523 [Leptospira borgpetersenii serovar Javanica str. UI 09931]|uniref:Uncharacterized protein n=4 Tax=Leptospira borgpetersenii TaxID=174 RepID=M3FF66_LEPBO|nr:hypothetical protein C4Q31_06230 [Leptospira borgpetersenii serovar Ceylonica]EKP14851.1 hypothetical protein LEP1GSC128_1421 [Leptospira borgpetersenii str. 200801926]EKQ92654.1 hypothetical protein LEP1GSC101_2931 [Leptospira borgpetersenii str. UI 09149]EMG00503.1 hypothetical protein LEP1GSC123_2805 [Leptospira borgpetersenii str. 200701203]EMK12409.1 hypothetical protein LEP1GSC066_3176 [Leptospira sp. serovar Kenya str. Sh9]EMN13383.1 hypothetical protein LEP1GSC055_1003 [Leptospira b
MVLGRALKFLKKKFLNRLMFYESGDLRIFTLRFLLKLKYTFFECITQHEHITQIFIQEIFHKIKYY